MSWAGLTADTDTALMIVGISRRKLTSSIFNMFVVFIRKPEFSFPICTGYMIFDGRSALTHSHGFD